MIRTHTQIHTHTNTHTDVRVIKSLIACGGDNVTHTSSPSQLTSLTLPSQYSFQYSSSSPLHPIRLTHRLFRRSVSVFSFILSFFLPSFTPPTSPSPSLYCALICPHSSTSPLPSVSPSSPLLITFDIFSFSFYILQDDILSFTVLSFTHPFLLTSSALPLAASLLLIPLHHLPSIFIALHFIIVLMHLSFPYVYCSFLSLRMLKGVKFKHVSGKEEELRKFLKVRNRQTLTGMFL